MFKDLSIWQAEMVFRALKRSVETCGDGFHNNDRGHPVYWAGSKGDLTAFPDADGPEKNDMFKMLSSLSSRIKQDGSTNENWWFDFTEWRDFCAYAFKAHEQA